MFGDRAVRLNEKFFCCNLGAPTDTMSCQSELSITHIPVPTFYNVQLAHLEQTCLKYLLNTQYISFNILKHTGKTYCNNPCNSVNLEVCITRHSAPGSRLGPLPLNCHFFQHLNLEATEFYLAACSNTLIIALLIPIKCSEKQKL